MNERLFVDLTAFCPPPEHFFQWAEVLTSLVNRELVESRKFVP
jgi:hypothetical protein